MARRRCGWARSSAPGCRSDDGGRRDTRRPRRQSRRSGLPVATRPGGFFESVGYRGSQSAPVRLERINARPLVALREQARRPAATKKQRLVSEGAADPARRGSPPGGCAQASSSSPSSRSSSSTVIVKW
jgi:hypothetical protein